jgi:hypothetical protein
MALFMAEEMVNRIRQSKIPNIYIYEKKGK